MIDLNWLIPFGAGLLAGVVFMMILYGIKKETTKQIAAELVKQSQEERVRDLEAIIGRLKESFTALSYAALHQNSEQFLTIAGSTLKSQAEKSELALENKKQLIDRSLEAVSKELEKVYQAINEFEKDREKKFGELNNQLRNTAEQTARLRDAAENLRSVLTNPKARGEWGERMAEDILERIGLVEGINYQRQKSSASGNRPDFTFFLPKKLKVNMDVKFPLNSYIQYIQAEDPGLKAAYLLQFAKDVRGRIKEVTGRDYINPEEGTVDYVLVFIPNEQIYGFIHETDSTLIDEALRNKVVLCSPLTLYAYLAIIRQAAENFNLEEAAGQVLVLMDGFHKQWDAFCATFERMGRKLEEAQKEYTALLTTRRSRMERVLSNIDELRRRRSLPLSAFGEGQDGSDEAEQAGTGPGGKTDEIRY